MHNDPDKITMIEQVELCNRILSNDFYSIPVKVYILVYIRIYWAVVNMRFLLKRIVGVDFECFPLILSSFDTYFCGFLSKASYGVYHPVLCK